MHFFWRLSAWTFGGVEKTVEMLGLAFFCFGKVDDPQINAFFWGGFVTCKAVHFGDDYGKTAYFDHREGVFITLVLRAKTNKQDKCLPLCLGFCYCELITGAGVG